MPIKQRAVHPDQKQERRQAILDAAWRLFQKKDYLQINMNDIAHATGLAKGTTYRYFETKEALFLALLQQQLELWVKSLELMLQKLPRQSDQLIQGVAESLANSFQDRPELMRLLAIWHVTLEQNIDYSSTRQFRAWLAARLLQTGAMIEIRLTFLAHGQGVTIILRTLMLAIGIQHMAAPPPVSRQVLASEPNMGIFHVPFRETLSQSLIDMLNGIANQ